jgi:hypothetical protein
MSSAEARSNPPARRPAALLTPIFALLLVAIPLVLGQQVTASIVQDVGTATDVSNLTGLEAPETGQSGPFRWGDPTVGIRLQPLGYPLYAIMTVQGVRTAGLPEAQVGATSMDEALRGYVAPRYPITIEYRLPAATLLAINPELIVTSTTFQPPGDRRQLGVAFYRIEQRSGPGPSLPSLWPAAALLLSGLLWFFYVLLLTGSARLALIVTAALGIAIGLLNAIERPWLVFYSWYFPVLPLVGLLTYPWLAGIRRRAHEPPTEEEPVVQPDVTTNAWPIAIAVMAAALALMLWHLVAPQPPAGFNPTDNVGWGVSFYQALPWPLQLLGVAIVAGAILWAYFSPLLQGQEDSSQLPRWTPWALAAGSMALFALLPVAYSEGDSLQFDTRIPEGAIWRERALLDFYIKVRLWRLLRPIFVLPSQIFAGVAVVTGGIYMGGTALLGRTLGRNRTEALFIIGVMAAIGNILLFFRYVETYSSVTAISIFVLWACWQYTEGRLSFGSVGALATLAPFLHGSALWWGPMVVAAWLVRAFRRPKGDRWRPAFADLGEGVGVGLAIVAIVASIALIDAYDYNRFKIGLSEMGGSDGHTMIELFQTVTRLEYYTYFSLPHLGAAVQEQLLVAPLALITIAIIAVAAWPGVRKLARVVPALITLAVGAGSMLFFTISWNPDLGPRDDWDLLGLSALPLSLLAAYLLLHLPYGRPRRLALAAYLTVSAVHAAAWVGLHVLGIRY